MDLGDHMENRRRESLCTTGPCKGPVTHLEVEPRHCGQVEGRTDTEGGGGGQVGGEVVRVVTPTPPGSLAPDEGVVSSCG